MKYLIAISLCCTEIFLYAIIGALLGWKHGGGFIPMFILIAVLGLTWRVITKKPAASTD